MYEEIIIVRPIYQKCILALKTLFNIVEVPFKTVMFVLYDVQKFWNLCGHYQDIYD